MAQLDQPSFPITPRNRVRRKPDRGRFDRKTVYDILDAAMVAHIAYVIDGQPYCTPTGFWREDDKLYWHGSAASRMIRSQSNGMPVCVTATHLDATRARPQRLPPLGQLSLGDGVWDGSSG